MAVRNPLDGEVEDLPGSKPRETLHGAADTMPFYVIVAGLAPDVRHAMETLGSHTRLKEAPMLQLFFSRKTPVRGTAPAAIDEVGGYSPVTDDYDGQGIKLIALPQTGKVTARWPGAAEAGAGVMDLGTQARMVPTVEAFDAEGKATASAEAASALTVCGPGPCVAIDGSKLAKGMYRVRLDRIRRERGGPGTGFARDAPMEYRTAGCGADQPGDQAASRRQRRRTGR